MDRSKRNVYIALAIALGIIAGLAFIIFLIVGGKAAVPAAMGIGLCVGTSALVLGIMTVCGVFTSKT